DTVVHGGGILKVMIYSAHKERIAAPFGKVCPLGMSLYNRHIGYGSRSNNLAEILHRICTQFRAVHCTLSADMPGYGQCQATVPGTNLCYNRSLIDFKYLNQPVAVLCFLRAC